MTRALALVVLLGGCSISLQAKPYTPTLGNAEQQCSTSSRYWIADAVISGASAAAMIGGRVYADVAPEHDTLAYTTAGLGAVLAVLYLASANEGRKWANECRSSQGTSTTAAR